MPDLSPDQQVFTPEYWNNTYFVELQAAYPGGVVPMDGPTRVRIRNRDAQHIMRARRLIGGTAAAVYDGNWQVARTYENGEVFRADEVPDQTVICYDEESLRLPWRDQGFYVSDELERHNVQFPARLPGLWAERVADGQSPIATRTRPEFGIQYWHDVNWGVVMAGLVRRPVILSEMIPPSCLRTVEADVFGGTEKVLDANPLFPFEEQIVRTGIETGVVRHTVDVCRLDPPLVKNAGQTLRRVNRVEVVDTFDRRPRGDVTTPRWQLASHPVLNPLLPGVSA